MLPLPSPHLTLACPSAPPLQALRLNPPEAGRAHGSPDPSGDERSVALLYLASAPEFDILQLLYPRLYQVHGLHAPLHPPAEPEGPIKGVEVRRLTSPSSEFLSLGEVFVLDTWTALYLYVSREVGKHTYGLASGCSMW